ncbi:hypothetical protein ACFLXY_07010 [Chloroflexota bacterium]
MQHRQVKYQSLGDTTKDNALNGSIESAKQNAAAAVIEDGTV